MNLEQAKIQLLFNEGILKKAVATAEPMKKGVYNVFFIKNDNQKVFCVLARTEERRVFKSLNAAASFAKLIGFEKMEVML